MKIYCSGIGGVGLSAYAALQNAAGHEVSGSDRSQSDLTDDLRSQGITVYLDQDGSGLDKDTDLFVYSEAIPETAPERVKATEFGIEQQSYFHALGVMSKGYNVIGVCGTHGKSSTTSMASQALCELGVDPNIVVGTKVPFLKGRNWRSGLSSTFLLEACEYRRSFLHLSPNVILMTSVEGDHFDAYKDLEDYQNAYIDFLKLLPDDGVVITHMTDGHCRHVVEASGVENVIDCDSQPLVDLQVPGLHMQQNAKLVLALAEYLQLDLGKASASLKNYKGCWRRLELKGEYVADNFTVPVIDDYGHHPNEIYANLAALRGKYPDSRIVCVFQPHTHDRTLKLYDRFTTSFVDADVVIIPNIYDARSDIESQFVRVGKFVEDIASYSSVEAIHGHSLEQTEAMLRGEILQEGDILICMGAGDITKLASRLI